MRKWDRWIQITNKEVEVKERVEKVKCLFSEKKGRKRIYCCYVRKAKMATEVVNIMYRKINEATAFRKLFSKDKISRIEKSGVYFM
jgi:hypothetical protein